MVRDTQHKIKFLLFNFGATHALQSAQRLNMDLGQQLIVKFRESLQSCFHYCGFGGGCLHDPGLLPRTRDGISTWIKASARYAQAKCPFLILTPPSSPPRRPAWSSNDNSYPDKTCAAVQRPACPRGNQRISCVGHQRNEGTHRRG